MSDVLFNLGEYPVSPGMAAAVAGLVMLALLCLILWRQGRMREMAAMELALRTQEADQRLRDLARIQHETAGRVQSMAEVLSQRQSELARVVAERLDHTSHRLNQSMANASSSTHESLTRIAERLMMVEAAERSLSDLSAQVLSLRETLSNKQARGAFGQARMEAIIADGLPKGSYAFQHTLSNGKRPDCAIFLPGDPRPLIIDAKFPLESVTQFREARTAEARKAAATRLRTDLMKHVNDVATRYLLAGETQDIALIFVPSESVYADIQEHMDAVVQAAFRARVILVSPSLMMLAVQLVQAIARDARMREEADRIRTEVGALIEDVARLRERVNDLGRHFSQAGDDLAKLTISADKISRRGARLQQLEFGEAPEQTHSGNSQEA